MPVGLIAFCIGTLVGALIGFFVSAICFTARIADYEADIYAHMQDTFSDQIAELRRQNSSLLNRLATQQ